MAEDKHTSRCSNSSSGGGSGGDDSGGHRCSKKLKRKKVPQRGMGVAQLEKIISEQQQMKDATVVTHNSSSNLQALISSSSIQPQARLPPNHHPLSSKTDGINTNRCGLWSDGDYRFGRANQSQSQNQNQNLGGLRYESSPSIWPQSRNLMLQRSQHLQQHCSSSMVNVSAGPSLPLSSSVLNFQIEPPSNQSNCGSNYHPLWSEEKKTGGMKRPYPFSLENAPIPSLHCKFPLANGSAISRSDHESASGSNGGTTSVETVHPYFREHPSSSSPIPGTITKKFIDENQVLTRDFLKLAHPQAPQSNLSSKEKLYHSTQKGQSEDPSHLSGRGGSSLPQFLGFFPDARTPMEQPGNSNGEAGESIDLNLKL